MRRKELLSGTEQIVHALKVSRIPEALDLVAEYVARAATKKNRPTVAILNAFSSYSALAEDFNDPAAKIAEILNLKSLLDPNVWTELIEGDTAGKDAIPTNLIWSLRSNVRFAIDHLPKIIKLVEQEPLTTLAETSKQMPKGRENFGLFSVLVLEDPQLFSTPSRLAELFIGLTKLYEVCARLLDRNQQDLVLIACDSGSDQSFDFLGAAKVIECLKEILLSVWDRVVFFKERRLFQHLDMIKESLPIIERISQYEKDGKLGPEDAEILRRKIVDGVGAFLKSGAVIPEIMKASQNDVRALMSPEPKLLGAGPTQPPIESTPTSRGTAKPASDQKPKRSRKKKAKPTRL